MRQENRFVALARADARAAAELAAIFACLHTVGYDCVDAEAQLYAMLRLRRRQLGGYSLGVWLDGSLFNAYQTEHGEWCPSLEDLKRLHAEALEFEAQQGAG